MAEGCGRLLAGDERLVSARAETAALATVLLVLEPSLVKGRRITVHVDNAQVVNTYDKSLYTRAKGWAKVADRDLWDVIDVVLERAGPTAEGKRRVQVCKVKAHLVQDTEVQKEGDYKGKVKPPEAITEHE